MARAYPCDDRTLIADIQINLPPVDLIAGAMRETKGRLKEENETTYSPLWGAVMSALSMLEADRARSKYLAMEGININDIRLIKKSDYLSRLASALDWELLNVRYRHACVVTNARLWNFLDQEQEIKEVGSVRFCMSRFSDFGAVVDVVNSESIERYIDGAVTIVSKDISQSRGAVAEKLSDLNWAVGTGIKRLSSALAAKKPTQSP